MFLVLFIVKAALFLRETMYFLQNKALTSRKCNTQGFASTLAPLRLNTGLLYVMYYLIIHSTYKHLSNSIEHSGSLG